jgi:hypothetical protein
MERIPPIERSMQPVMRTNDIPMLSIIKIQDWSNKVERLPGEKNRGTRNDEVKKTNKKTKMELGRFESLKRFPP